MGLQGQNLSWRTYETQSARSPNLLLPKDALVEIELVAVL
jgi:hypothetical protein